MIRVGMLFSCVKSKQWRYPQACHLYCDIPTEIAELHKFAQKLELLRRWFQAKTAMPHYDLTAGKRLQAISLGAVETSQATEAAHIRKWRRDG